MQIRVGDKKKMNAQHKVYVQLSAHDWEYEEEFPAAGLIIMRRNTSSIPDFFSWIYCTIDRHGKIYEGRKEP